MFTNYSFDVISTVSEWNEIAYGLNNGLIKWDFLERELRISNRESKHNYFYEEEDMGFGMETKYSYVEDEVRNLSQLFPTAIIKCVSHFEGDYESYTFWYCNGDDQGHKSDAGKKREDVYSAEVMRFLTMDVNKSDGLYHQAEVLSDGTVKAEGANIFRECDVSGWTDIQAVSCGNWHTVGLKKDGTLVACGSNVNGQCNVSDIAGKAVVVSCGRYHTAILLESGKVIIKGYLEDEVKNAKPLSPDSIPEICKLNLSKTVKGWEKMNKLIEDISSGDELIIKPVIKDGGAASFEVCNSNGKKIGNLGGILREYYDDFATMLDKIKAYAEDVAPLSKKGPRAKYATMNVRLQYIGSNEEINRSGKYKQTPVEEWPAVKTIRSVFDAVIGVTEDGQIFVSGFCPLTEEEIQMLINNELVEYFEKQNAIDPINKTEIEKQDISQLNKVSTYFIPDEETGNGNGAIKDTQSEEIDGKDFMIEEKVLCKYLGTKSKVVIPDGVTNIGNDAFRDCSSPTSIIIPECVTNIGSSAFENCSSLTSVNIPDSVTSIGDHAFMGCKRLTSVTIPDSVTSIGESVFEDCTSLSSVVISSSVTSIRRNTFFNCSSLTSVIIPEKVTDIERSAFNGCTSLISVVIPDSVTCIGEKAFQYCTSLKSLIIGGSVTNIGYEAFRFCSSLTSVTIPESVTIIGKSAFRDCISLSSVTIPDSLTNIAFNAFWGCKMKKVPVFGYVIDGSQCNWDSVLLSDVQSMLKNKDYAIRMDHGVKFQLIVQLFLKNKQPEAEAYIKKNISKILPFFIDIDDQDTVKGLLGTGKFVTKKNIEKFIDCAAEHTKNGGDVQIQTILQNYKRVNFPDLNG